MEWSDLISSGLSVASGGIFGLLGSVIGVGAKYLQEKQRQKWEKAKWDQEARLLKMQMEAKQIETEQELAIVAQQGSWSGLQASMEHDAGLQSGIPVVAGIRSLFRPFLTTVLWVLAAWVFYKIITGGLQAWMSRQETADLIRYMVYTTFFSASTATAWWFGDRALTPPGQKAK